MARPQRHPETGVYYLRKRVPPDLLSVVGKSVVKLSLRTKDPTEARRLHALELTKLEQQWTGLQRGLLAPTPLEINVMAGDFYRTIVRGFEKGPLPFFGMMSCSGVANAFVEAPGDEAAHRSFVSTFGARIDAYLGSTGRRIRPDCRGALDLAVARAVADATARGIGFLEGDFGEDVREKRYATASAPLAEPIPMAEAFDEYAAAADLSPATVKRWRPAIVAFATHCGHGDLGRLTREEVAAWIAALRTSGRSPRTIRDVYVAAAKALHSWYKAEKGLRSDAFEGFRVKVPERPKLRSPGLTDAEAERILKAALEPQPARISPHHRAARRWVPWLAAYTGARINEITQLRVQDVRQEDGVWIMSITPEAGTVKTKKARSIPLHPHLVEQGFLKFVRAARNGPLFYADGVSKANAANPPYKKMGERLAAWVRDIGVDDREVDPNHGWRHRFKSVGRQAGVQDHILDVIQGHALLTEGRKYGDFSLSLLLKQMLLMPRYEIKHMG